MTAWIEINSANAIELFINVAVFMTAWIEMVMPILTKPSP